MFDLIAVSASIPSTKLDGSAWDAFGGLPDPVAEGISHNSTGTTPYRSNTLKPIWNDAILIQQTAADLKKGFTLTITDSDTSFNDLIGGCRLTLSDADFDGAIHTQTCPATNVSAAVTFDYKVEAK